MSESFECGCGSVKPQDGEIHVVMTAFYEDKKWPGITIFKGKDTDFQEFVDRMNLFSHSMARSLAGVGALSGKYAERHRKQVLEDEENGTF